VKFPILFLLIIVQALSAAERCVGARDLRLVNGRIHTMDAKDSVVSSVVIQNGRFYFSRTKPGACTKTIDLKGSTAVPGLIDNHNHIVLLGIRPGYDTRLEGAASIADVQALLRERAHGVPVGGFITAMGGWNPAQFAEKRLPTLAELDAADASHPIIVYQAFAGPSATNAKAREFFLSRAVAVSDAGLIAANAPSLAALNALRAMQTLEDQKRGTKDALAYSVRMGVTTNVDMGAFHPPGNPGMHDAFAADTLATASPYTMYDAVNTLHREGALSARLRLFFLTMDTKPDVPMLQYRLENAFHDFGDNMLRVSGIGEFASEWPLFGQKVPANYETALRLVAQRGWAFQQHSLSLNEDQLTASTFEKVNAQTPIAPLRWSIAHTPHIDAATIERFKALGVGIAIHPYTYLAGAPGSGPPVKTIVESGVHAGAGSDSAQISTLNPWLIIYAMVTGKNAAGTLINDGQQISRAMAMRLYTANNGWFFHEEGALGSIEQGKLGDVAVLSGDYFDAKKVSDEGIKKLHSTLTIIGGKVVYSELPR